MEYICGVTFAPFACAGAFFKPGANESLAMMKERTGANFVIFVPGDTAVGGDLLHIKGDDGR